MLAEEEVRKTDFCDQKEITYSFMSFCNLQPFMSVEKKNPCQEPCAC
jgi:hypothetical protein